MSDRGRSASDDDGTIDWPTPGDPPATSGSADEQPTVVAPTHRASDPTDVTRVRPQTPNPPTPPNQYPSAWGPHSPHGMPAAPPPSAGPGYPGAFRPPTNYPPQSAGWPNPGSAPRTGSHKKWWLIGLCAVVAVSLVAVGVLTFTRDGAGSGRPSAAPTTARSASSPVSTSASTSPPTTSTTAATPAVPPVQPDQLGGFLLAPADIMTAVGNPTPPMRAGKIENALISGGQYTPANCASTYGPAEQSAYANSGYTGVAAQPVDQGPDGSNGVIQAAISFPSASAAADYYKQTFDHWKDCAGQSVTATILSNPPSRIQVDSKPSDISGTSFLSIVPETKPGRPFRFCSRSMTAANNVIVDVRSCITDASASLASKTIAQAIAGKITG